MRITVSNCHVANRGDEAAIRAMVYEINDRLPGVSIILLLRNKTKYPNMPDNVLMHSQFIPKNFKSMIAYYLCLITKGHVVFSKSAKRTINAIKSADIVLHAPGGPSIGDIYYQDETTYLRFYNLVHILQVPYMFYAPSMGPFNNVTRKKWRRRVLKNAMEITVRDPISYGFASSFVPEKKITLTMDSALQYDIKEERCKKIFDQSKDLKQFFKIHRKCVGITITDLKWHPKYKKDEDVGNRIKDSFEQIIEYLTSKGYGIVFIPQLYGDENDYSLMSTYCNSSHCYILSNNVSLYDSDFQQFMIGKLYAMIGMRYHSNIFSAKMGTPFLSVSYEQKMKGFMDRIGCEKYCIDVEDLTPRSIKEKFHYLESTYEKYKSYLKIEHEKMKTESLQTTEILFNILKDLSN